METTIDSAGRLVIPKAVREAVGLRPGVPLEIRGVDGRVEIEPAPRKVRLVRRGRLHVLQTAEAGPPLEEATVRRARRALRTTHHRGE